MRSPTINQYLETLNNVQGLFRTLEGISAERDLYGDPIFRVGNFAVLFKVRIDDKLHALKCYTRETERNPAICKFLENYPCDYLVPVHWLPDEVYIYDEHEQGSYAPVMLMEWIEGDTLGRHVGKLAQHGENDALVELAVGFDRLAINLLGQPFAHGDLKHDNILVTPQNEFKLIDYDGMFLPQFQNIRSSLIGSPAYQHPARDDRYFNPHIDDYPIGIICLSLHALAEDPTLYAAYNDRENLIFNAAEVANGNSELMNRLEQKWLVSGNSALLSLCRMLRTRTPELPDLKRVLENLSGNGISVGGSACGHLPVQELPFEVIDDTDKYFAVVRHKGLCGYADLYTGEMKIEPVYESAMPYSEGRALVLLNRTYRFIDHAGKTVIDCSGYDAVSPFREGLARVRQSDRYGFIDINGNEVIPPVFDMATGFREGLSVVRVGAKYGYCDPKGKIIIPVQYDAASHFTEGEAHVVLSGHSFTIDKTGDKNTDM